MLLHKRQGTCAAYMPGINLLRSASILPSSAVRHVMNSCMGRQRHMPPGVSTSGSTAEKLAVNAVGGYDPAENYAPGLQIQIGYDT
jgi:hypothetical protein